MTPAAVALVVSVAALLACAALSRAAERWLWQDPWGRRGPVAAGIASWGIYTSGIGAMLAACLVVGQVGA